MMTRLDTFLRYVSTESSVMEIFSLASIAKNSFFFFSFWFSFNWASSFWPFSWGGEPVPEEVVSFAGVGSASNT